MRAIHSSLIGALVLGLLTLLIAAAGALGIVSFRHHMTELAYHSKALELQLVKAENRESYLNSKLAAFHNPAYLKNRMEGTLNIPVDRQVVWVKDVAASASKKAQPEPASSTKANEPFSVSLDLAFLATTSK